jgi:hypothetical protein
MDHQLKLTARGHAVCELMADFGLTLDAACSRVDGELEALRQRVDSILTESEWEDVPRAVQAALDGVSPHVQGAYLEESASDDADTAPASAPWHGGVFMH